MKTKKCKHKYLTGDYLPISSNTPLNPPHPQYPATDIKNSQMARKLTCFHISNTNTEGMELKWSICPTLVNNQNLRLL